VREENHEKLSWAALIDRVQEELSTNDFIDKRNAA
jgi:hypothetical protein